MIWFWIKGFCKKSDKKRIYLHVSWVLVGVRWHGHCLGFAAVSDRPVAWLNHPLPIRLLSNPWLIIILFIFMSDYFINLYTFLLSQKLRYILIKNKRGITVLFMLYREFIIKMLILFFFNNSIVLNQILIWGK